MSSNSRAPFADLQPLQPLPTGESLTLPVTAEWHVTRVRNVVRLKTQAMCSSRLFTAYVTTAVSELATNLYFHTDKGGSITIGHYCADAYRAIEIIAEDEGPGIPDVELVLVDGFSTNGGLGGGLPGAKRLMDEFQINSQVGVGTRVMCRKWTRCK